MWVKFQLFFLRNFLSLVNLVFSCVEGPSGFLSTIDASFLFEISINDYEIRMKIIRRRASIIVLVRRSL